MKIYKVDKDFNHEFIGDIDDFKKYMDSDVRINLFTTTLKSVQLSNIYKYGTSSITGYFFIDIDFNFQDGMYMKDKNQAIKSRIITEVRNNKINKILK